MRDDLDHRVHDAVALDEIDLVSDVLSAVAAVDRPLTDDEIDAVLGVRQPRGAAPGAPARTELKPAGQASGARGRRRGLAAVG